MTRALLVSCLAALLAACASPPSVVQSPAVLAPLPHTLVPERPANGAIYQTSMSDRALFSAENRPRRIGDLIKVEITERFAAAIKANMDSSRETGMQAKGPGSSGGKGALSRLLDLDASASGKDTVKGGGNTGTEGKFDGQIVASVINVMPNGHLLLAGERVNSLDGNLTTLRFAGMIHPRDIRAGGIVSSNDVAGARLEMVSSGDLADSTRRSWIQRVLSNAYAIW